VAWSNQYCSRESEWLCAEFAARSLGAGGFFSKCTNSSCYCNGPYGNLCTVSNLVKAIKSNGMKFKGTGREYACKKSNAGDIGIYMNEGHAVFMTGACKTNQHNPNKCGTTAEWDGPVIYGC